MGRDGKKGGFSGRGGGRGGGRGSKDKRGPGGRGGGGERLYIENIDELMLREKGRLANSDDEEDDEESEGESSEEEEQEAQEGEKSEQPAGAESVFEFAKKSAATEEDGADGELTKSFGAAKQIDPNDPNAGMNRKEREALAKQKAKEDYQRRHAAGETEQARAELARLALVRARREAAAKKREAEGRAPGMTASGLDNDDDNDDLAARQKALNAAPIAIYAAATPAPAPVKEEDPIVAAKKKAAAGGDEDDEKAEDGGPPLLKAMDIKKMNGDALKDHCKARGLDIRGQKKDLMKRLIDHEAERVQKIEAAKK